MEYTYLTKEDQKAMVEARARQFEGEHYSNTLALQAATALIETLPNDPPVLPQGQVGLKAQAVAEAAQLTKNLGLIETACDEAKKEITVLDAELAVPVDAEPVK